MMRRIFSLAVLVVVLVFSAPLMSSAQDSVESLRERALNLYRVQDYRGALSLFLRVVEEKSDDGSAWDYAGWCYRYQREWENSLRCFDRALALLPGVDGAWVLVGVGETNLGKGEHRQACVAFQDAMKRSPDDRELKLRCLKGVTWACVFDGDLKGYEQALKALSDEDEETARSVQKDLADEVSRVRAEESARQAVVEKESSKDSQPQAVGEKESSKDSQPQAQKDSKSAQKSDKKAKAPEKPSKKQKKKKASGTKPDVLDAPKAPDKRAPVPDKVLCELILGAPLEEEFSKLAERGGRFQRAPEKDAQSLTYYRITPPKTWDVGRFLKGADRVSITVDEFEDKVFRGTVESVYRFEGGPSVSRGQALFELAVEDLSKVYEEPFGDRNRGVSKEILWNASSGRMVKLSTDSLLNGEVRLAVTVADRVLFGRFLIETRK